MLCFLLQPTLTDLLTVTSKSVPRVSLSTDTPVAALHVDTRGLRVAGVGVCGTLVMVWWAGKCWIVVKMKLGQKGDR